jgi:hypothetical protein
MVQDHLMTSPLRVAARSILLTCKHGAWAGRVVAPPTFLPRQYP